MSNMTKKDALKAIVEALGESSTAKTDKDIIFEIAEAIGDSGSDRVFTINLTYDETTEKYTADKTFREISEAFLSGKTCISVSNEPGDNEGEYSRMQSIVKNVYDEYSDSAYTYSVSIDNYTNSLSCSDMDDYPTG